MRRLAQNEPSTTILVMNLDSRKRSVVANTGTNPWGGATSESVRQSYSNVLLLLDLDLAISLCVWVSRFQNRISYARVEFELEVEPCRAHVMEISANSWALTRHL